MRCSSHRKVQRAPRPGTERCGRRRRLHRQRHEAGVGDFGLVLQCHELAEEGAFLRTEPPAGRSAAATGPGQRTRSAAAGCRRCPAARDRGIAHGVAGHAGPSARRTSEGRLSRGSPLVRTFGRLTPCTKNRADRDSGDHDGSQQQPGGQGAGTQAADIGGQDEPQQPRASQGIDRGGRNAASASTCLADSRATVRTGSSRSWRFMRGRPFAQNSLG